MKHIVHIVILLGTVISHAQITLIPDPAFEQALIDLGIDSDGVVNGQVATSDVEGVAVLDVAEEGISDLTGLEDFVALENLDISFNNILSVDLSNNIQLQNLQMRHCQVASIDLTSNVALRFLTIPNNLLSDLDVSNNSLLEYLDCGNPSIDVGPFNQIESLDLTGNPGLLNLKLDFLWSLESLNLSNNVVLREINALYSGLNNLDLSNNPQLTELIIGEGYNPEYGENPSTNITELDLSNNPNLNYLNITYTRITSLNLKSGNNPGLTSMWAEQNPQLFCIQVDDQFAANNGQPPYGSWHVDPWINYREDCTLGIEDLFSSVVLMYPNPTSHVINFNLHETTELSSVCIYDSVGRLILEVSNSPSQIDVSQLPNGLFVIIMETNRGSIIKKLVKA